MSRLSLLIVAALTLACFGAPALADNRPEAVTFRLNNESASPADTSSIQLAPAFPLSSTFQTLESRGFHNVTTRLLSVQVGGREACGIDARGDVFVTDAIGCLLHFLLVETVATSNPNPIDLGTASRTWCCDQLRPINKHQFRQVWCEDAEGNRVELVAKTVTPKKREAQ